MIPIFLSSAKDCNLLRLQPFNKISIFQNLNLRTTYVPGGIQPLNNHCNTSFLLLFYTRHGFCNISLLMP